MCQHSSGRLGSVSHLHKPPCFIFFCDPDNVSFNLSGTELRVDKSQQGQQEIVSQGGYLLLEAPTGIGKTLMAAHIAEELSRQDRVIWFWFTPFAGLATQTARSIRNEGFQLRVRSLVDDRLIETIQSGDIFVTTWGSAAVANAESRRIRRDSETMPSLDLFLEVIRNKGYTIGVIIDEAHHSFRDGTQAVDFYRDVLQPSLTILVTATPRDRDITAFLDLVGRPILNRVSIARRRGVDADLLKKGVKVGLFRTSYDTPQELINFEETAIMCGVRTHQELQGLLADIRPGMTPLLLIQVDSRENSVQDAVATAIKYGVPEQAIRIHTADEPDPNLMTLANDDDVEALVFKMAIATGFDAPRAFTLVSLRSSRDPEFGVQVVGRLMRVDRRLQNVSKNQALDYGYVFLADNSRQQGLLDAASRINAIQDELSDVSPSINVQTLAFPQLSVPTLEPLNTKPEYSFETETPQVEINSIDAPPLVEAIQPLLPVEFSAPVPIQANVETGESVKPTSMASLLNVWGLKHEQPVTKERGKTTPVATSFRIQQERVLWPKQPFPSVPQALLRAIISPDQKDLLADIIRLFPFDDELINLTQRDATRIIKDTVEVFTLQRERPEEIHALLARKEIDRQAQRTLLDSVGDGLLDVRKLHAHNLHLA
ncbi:hypothetical protein EJ104_13735 [Deinococcus radiophilus]|uniref:Helicase ATP-binding domain-containing protein n=2 Tax=Deinococcus radiophilus TaxID=32062 RepID=A0A431VDZ0_9DEIO|nr:hypothetical protein EJ104_13735 [Deinococcus radiophilus]